MYIGCKVKLRSGTCCGNSLVSGGISSGDSLPPVVFPPSHNLCKLKLKTTGYETMYACMCGYYSCGIRITEL